MLTVRLRRGRCRHILLFDVLADLLGNFLTGVAVGVLQQHDEFLTAPAADDVGVAQATLQIAGKPNQHLIAGHVPVGVVQHLEVIEIEQQRRQRFGFALRFVQGLSGEQVEAAAVGQFGEAVEGGLRLDFAFDTV